MWKDILKINAQPNTKSAKSRYVKRLIIRFLEYIPNNQPFSYRTVINFYNSPEQEQHKNINDWEPSTKQIVAGLNKQYSVKKKSIRVGLNNIDLYGQYDALMVGGNLQSLFVVGDWPEKVRLDKEY